MPQYTIIIPPGYTVQKAVIPRHRSASRPRHTPRHRSASRPRPILKAAAQAVRDVFKPGPDHAPQRRRTLTRANSTPYTHNSPYYIDNRSYYDDRGRGRDRERSGHRVQEEKHYKEDERKRREASRQRKYRAEEPKHEHREHRDKHAAHGQRHADEYRYYPADKKKPTRRASYGVDELTRNFSTNMQITYAQTNAYYAAPPPSPSYYPQSFVPYAPPSPAYAAPNTRFGAPVIPGYAPAVYNGRY